MSSGNVYQLSAAVRSIVTNDSSVRFGGRVSFYLPPQKEMQLTWVNEHNDWWRQTLVFTNSVDGVATILVHMGYGGAASTGEFADIRLERLTANK